MQDAFQNAPRRLTRRCTSPAAANGAIRYAVTDEPITAATCHCRDCQYSSGGAPAHALLFPAGSVTLRGAASTATAAVRAAPSCAASARTVARRYSAAPRAPTTTWSAPARSTTRKPSARGSAVDRLGAVLAPHRCRRAQFSRQCATDSLRPTRYAAANSGRVLQDSPFLHATSGLPWRAVHLYGLLHHLRQLARGVLGGDLGQRQGLDLAGVAGGTELGVAGDTDRLGGGARRLQVFARIELAGVLGEKRRTAPVMARRMSVSMLILRTPNLMASWISSTGTP